jgi:hypothetical protein
MGLGLVVAFRCRIWNIGGEGQYFAGALAGTVVGLLGQASLPAWLLIPMMLLAGIAGGALWAALAAWLKLAFEVNEIIATIMLNFVALYTGLLSGPRAASRSPWVTCRRAPGLRRSRAFRPCRGAYPPRRSDRAAARSRDLSSSVEDHSGLPVARHRLERPGGDIADLDRARRGAGALGSHLALYEGRIAGERRAGEANAEELGLMMGGRHEGPAHAA